MNRDGTLRGAARRARTFALLVLPVVLAACAGAPDTLPVDRVVDGDTLVVRDGGRAVTVRLIGVDTPESVHPRRPVEPFAKEAAAFLADLLVGARVRLVLDPEQGETDRYGRTLAYVYREPDGLFVNAEIVRRGWGRAYGRYPFRYLDDFRALEEAARRAGRGMWAAAGPPAR